MLDTVRTIGELTQALKENYDLVQHYLSQVTVEEDLCNYLKWLSDNEVTTEVVTHLKRHKIRAPGIHPSSAAKNKVCLLKLYYECTNEVEPTVEAYDQKTQMTWDMGTALHDMHQTWFSAMYGDQFKAEVPLKSKDGYIKSQTDGLFTFKHYRFILEMKSIKEGGNYGWAKVQAKPMDDNVRQAHFYMKLADVPYALIFYMNKNAGEFKEHAVMFSQALWDEMERDVLTPVINAAYKKGPAVAANPGWHCRWCLYQAGCPEKGGKDDPIEW
jgi:CRISPR/Cas system-associated exonuclease Cas4 (RecB family)